MKKYIPISLFVLLVALLGFGLTNDPKEVPSPFIDKSAPEFNSSRLYSDEKISTSMMKGQVWMLNVFASWCPSCRSEHDLVNYYAGVSNIPVIGLNYKDEQNDAKDWLKQLGNPYTAIALDPEGDIGIEWGVYGTPESFIIDKKGMIRHKQIGPISEQALNDIIIPLVAKLEKE